MNTYIYIYIERERDRYVCVYIYTTLRNAHTTPARGTATGGASA